MFNLFHKKNVAFGLDVSTSSIKIMLLDKAGLGVKVKGFSEIALPKGLILADGISDKKMFSHLFKQAMYKTQFGKIDTSYAVVSLPESKSFVRVIQIPVMSDKEAESAVPFEAESFIPMPIDQVYLDWQKLSVVGDKMNILIIASPKEFVDKFLSALDELAIKPVALEVESQSCHRSVVGESSTDTVLIADINSMRTSLIMVEDGKLQFTSSVPVAGSQFTESIARTLGVSSTKAEDIKRKVGLKNTPDYPNVKLALLPVLNNLSAEIRTILKFHNEHSDRKVGRIILTGGSAKLANLPESLAQDFADFPELKVELANPWANLSGLKEPPINSIEALGFTTAIGLSMRGVEN